MKRTYSANASHGVVDTAGSKTALDDLESLPFAQNHVLSWHADVIEGDVAMAVRGIVEAHNGQHAVDRDTGGVIGNEDN